VRRKHEVQQSSLQPKQGDLGVTAARKMALRSKVTKYAFYAAFWKAINSPW
jgi:hypothetical protein